MRNVTARIVLVAMLMVLFQYSVGAPVPQQDQDRVNMQSMTVAQLENAADLARARKDYPLAIQYFQTALKKDRKNSALYNKMGLAQLKNNDLRAARLSFESAVKLNSKFADAVNNIGAVDYMNKNYGAAAKHFKKAVALDETRASFHVNLGAAWFSQKKLDRALAEYSRAMELDPDALRQESRAGVVAQISSPEERARYSYMLAKIYAKRGDVDGCLQCLRKAKEEGYRDLANVYKDEDFSRMRDDPKLHEVVAPPTAK
ncbi:MAG: tetratricopeptide repeat protein [Candidatus Sulfotelmatobacter sp.]|jgi:tetratricopeptide (TPR) repeat protein